MQSQLQQQKLAEKKSAVIAIKLIKLAEQKVKTINTALNQYRTKNKVEFPVTSFRIKEYRGGGGGFLYSPSEYTKDEIILSQHSNNRMDVRDVQVGVYNDGSPYTRSFSFPIYQNRFFVCNTYYGKEFNSFQIPHYEYRDYGKVILGEPQAICSTITSPNRVLLIGKGYDPNRFESAMRDNHFTELTKDQITKYKTVINKSDISDEINKATNSAVWRTANELLDKFQNELIQSAKMSTERVSADEKYLQQSISQPITKIKL